MKRKWGRNKKLPIANMEIISLYETGISQKKVGENLGIDRRTVYARMKQDGYIVRPQKMETHSCWKGGIVIRNGYPFTRIPNHPRATKNGYVALHLLKIEEKLGKKVNGKNPIHHIDFDKMNYNINNLWLCNDEKEHRDIHCSLEYVAKELFRRGVIEFKNGKYQIK